MMKSRKNIIGDEGKERKGKKIRRE